MNKECTWWNLELLEQLCTPNLVQEIKKLEWSSIHDNDKLLWVKNETGVFYTKESFKVIINVRLSGEVNPIWKKICQVKVHKRLKMHLWRTITNTLPTCMVLVRRLKGMERSCLLRGSKEEDSVHLLMKCPFTKVVAFGSQWGCRLDQVKAQDLQSIGKLVSPPSHLCNIPWGKNFVSFFFIALLQNIWICWNERLFEGKKGIKQQVYLFNLLVREFDTC